MPFFGLWAVGLLGHRHAHNVTYVRLGVKTPQVTLSSSYNLLFIDWQGVDTRRHWTGNAGENHRHTQKTTQRMALNTFALTLQQTANEHNESCIVCVFHVYRIICNPWRNNNNGAVGRWWWWWWWWCRCSGEWKSVAGKVFCGFLPPRLVPFGFLCWFKRFSPAILLLLDGRT